MERALPPTAAPTRPAATPPDAGPRGLPKLAAAALFATALFDFLFWEQVSGFPPAVFTLALAGGILWAQPEAIRRTLPRCLLAGLVTLAGSICIDPTNLAIWLGWFGLAALALAARYPGALRGPQWALACLGVVTKGWFAWIPDFGVLRARLESSTGWRGRLGRWLGRWGLPAFLSLPFVALFVMANPLIEIGFEDFFEAIGDLLTALSLPRILMWAGVFAGAWALLRYRPRARAAEPGDRLVELSRKALHGAMLVRCLVVFNVLFAIQTTLDLGYFWSGFALPEGMTYAEYAHRGAYPLVATTLLAIVFILTAFHDREAGSSDANERQLASRLVYAWLAQNGFLLISAAARLDLYIDVYQLTYFRIASGIWMALIGVGLGWTAFKLATGRSNAWLIEVNLATAAIVLTLACFPNYDRAIAEFNVERAIERDARLDIYYLRQLGPEALPALRRYADLRLRHVEGDRYQLEEIDRMNREVLQRVERDASNWRGFSFRRAAFAGQLDHSWTPPPLPPLPQEVEPAEALIPFGRECSDRC